MTLAELVEDLENLDDNLTIYIQQDTEWSASSTVAVYVEPEDGSLPVQAVGMDYFLEVCLAKEVLEVWRKWRGGKMPSLSEKCDALIYYAKNDAYLPT